MSRATKAALAGVGLILMLLLAAALVVPRLVNLAAVRDLIVTRLSQQLGADVKLSAVRLSLPPLPHLVLDHVSLSIPDVVDATSESVSLYPRLLPLLRGRVQIGRLRLDEPNVKVHRVLPGGIEGAPINVGSLAGLRDTAASALAAVSSVAAARAPGLLVVVHHGSAELAVGSESPVLLRDVDGRLRLPPDGLGLDLGCESNLWGHLSLVVSLNEPGWTGSGRVDVTGLRLQSIATQIFPDDVAPSASSEADLHVNASLAGPNDVQAHIQLSIPSLPLRRGAETVVAKGAIAKGLLLVDESTTRVEVNDLRLAYPQVRLSGSLSLDHTAELVGLKVEAKDVDVPSVRTVATALAGEVAVTRRVFDILRGGKVPHIEVRATARSLAELGSENSLTVRGELSDGGIRVPGVDLDLDDVSGHVSVASGLLVGGQLAARFEKARAHGGVLRVGLSGAAPELHLETMVQAGVGEILPLLKRLVRNEPLSRALDRISDVTGAASGRLTLDGTTTSVHATADVEDFNLSGRLRGISQPLQIEGGRLLYDEGGIVATAAKATAGNSRLSQVSARIDWKSAPAALEITSGTSRVALDEIHAALADAGWLPDGTWNPKNLKGMLALNSMRVAGPAAVPAEWGVDLTGAVRDLDVDLRLLGELVAIGRPLSITNLRVTRVAAAGTSLSGEFAAPRALKGSFDLTWEAGRLNVKRLHIRDSYSDASFVVLMTPQQLGLRFSGNLSKATLSALMPDNHLFDGSLRGDFEAQIVRDEPGLSTAEGKLEASEVSVPLKGRAPLRVETAAIEAKGRVIDADMAIDAGQDTRFRVAGRVAPSPQALTVDLDLTARNLRWDAVENILGVQPEADNQAGSWPDMPVRGTVRMAAESFSYDKFTWAPLRASVMLGASRTTVTLIDADLCGIGMRGTISTTPQGFELAVQPTAQNQAIDATLKCLAAERALLTGRYRLTAAVTGAGSASEIFKSLKGHGEFTGEKGRIYRLGLVTKVLSFLGAATGSVGSFSDLTKEGLAYDVISIKGDLRDGTLQVEEAAIDGPSVKMAAQGSVDLSRRTIDMAVLVAPLKRVDTVVGSIPVIGGVLGGKLVSIPVKVTGTLDDPQVTPLPPAAVGKGLLGVMTRTARLPLTLIQPLLRSGTKRQ